MAFLSCLEAISLDVTSDALKKVLTPNLKLACNVCYHKIINTFENNIRILKQIVQGTQKMA